jgi:hypothetical protein
VNFSRVKVFYFIVFVCGVPIGVSLKNCGVECCLRFYYFLVDSPDRSPTEKLWSSVLVSFFHIKLDTFLFWCLDSRCESHWKVVE